jgi:hypothetical protein
VKKTLHVKSEVQGEVKRKNERMLDTGIIEPVLESNWRSPMVVKDKKT